MLTFLCIAEPSIAGDTSGYPSVIQDAVKNGISIVKSFPAASGLTGWVLERDGEHSIVYTTSDRKTMLVGNLVTDNGKILSAEYEDRYMPKADFAGLYAELEKAPQVVEGTQANPKRVLYIFTDPECPYCHLAWKALQPYEAAGLQVRWVMVAVIKPSSLPKAVEILGSANKTDTFRSMESNHGKPWNSTVKTDPSKAATIQKGLASNAILMERFKFGGTPGFVWKDEKGEVHLQAGMPKLSELPRITGLPRQKISDPEFARFQ
ncbi:thiol:disulfide interchange protein DsbG [Cupriavidus sp. 2SB]|uniref:thiol:disulfide interchange protein DsbG n=1 Tax=Cupriavidus sp. 2SB TaxID=2502199 RepID=UPI0014857A94|nr:thiol:disulfide interchange protein DsbG [Cupriavidus sp. 2SB]